jgi:DmsE family decaheme c-type cytochrome
MTTIRKMLHALVAMSGLGLLVLAAPASAAVPMGDAKCLTCHATMEKVLPITQTKHGVRVDGRTPTCTTCHGPSDRHAESAGGQKPDRQFGWKGKASSAEQQNEACSTCHESSARMHWKGSAHESNDVSCATCHRVHVAKDPVLTKATQPDVCYTCHKDKRAQMNRISHHPVPEGKMSCSSCHNPHGGVGPSNLKEATVNETCYTCHAEKRGPFLNDHPPAREDCGNCHQPHGSNHTPMLKARVPWLCQECHLAPQHPSSVYSGTGVPPVGAAQQILAKGCANCHQQVHGSNHPSGWRWTR